MNPQARTLSKPLFALFAVCSLAAVFLIPYFIPQAPSTSESWIFGYNNRAGILLVLAAVFIATMWTRGMNLPLPAPGSSPRIPVKVLVILLVTYLCAAAAMYLFAGRYGGFSEAAYFIDRAWLTEHGKVPYVDFEYCFGLSYLYGPILLQDLLHVSLIFAYHLYWLLNLLVAVVLGYLILNRINFPTKARLSIYLVLFIPGLFATFNMGVNYAGPRFLFPIYFVLVMRSIFQSQRLSSRIGAVFFALFCAAFMFLFSPETPFALAFTAACIFIISTPRWNRGLIAIFACMLVAFAALFWAIGLTHALDAIHSDGGGANSFPIAPSVPILYYFALLFFCASYAYRRFAERTFNDDCLALIIYSIPMVFAALGRCDPGHLASNGQGLVLASMFYASNYKTAWRRYRTLFIIFIFLLPTLSGLVLSSTLISRVSRMNASHTDPNNVTEADLNRTYPEWSGKFFVPWGFRPNGIGTYHSTRIDYGRFDGMLNMNTPHGVADTLQHMQTHPEEALLLPSHFENGCEINASGERVVISLLFDTIYLRHIAHPTSIRKPICDYILDHYEMVQPPGAQNFSYGLWLLKPVPPAFQKTSMNVSHLGHAVSSGAVSMVPVRSWPARALP